MRIICTTSIAATLGLACFLAAPASSSAQSTRLWDGGPTGLGTDLNFAENWTDDLVPTGLAAASDFAVWDGLVGGDLSLNYATAFGGGSSTRGIITRILSCQRGDLSITGTGTYRTADAFTIAPGAGAVTLNIGTASSYLALGGSQTAGTTHVIANDSSNLFTINASIINGGSVSRVANFSGAGDTLVTAPITQGTGNVGLTKSGVGTLTLTAASNYAGTTSISGGRLVANYENSTAVLPSGALTLNGGTLEIQAKAGAGNATAVSMGNFTAGSFNSSRIVVNRNGSDSAVLTLGGTLSSGGGIATVLFDVSSGSAVKATGTIGTADVADSWQIKNSLLMSGGATGANSARANLLVRDAGGIGFAMRDGDNNLVRFTGATALDASATSATAHYTLASDLTRTAGLSFSTLAIDTAANDVTLSMGTHGFNASAANGRSLLVTGANDATITSTSGGLTNSLFLRNYSTGVFTFDVSMGATALVSTGPGLTIVTRQLGADLYSQEGVLRVTANSPYTAGVLRLTSGGVLELGGDISSVESVDFSRGLGSTTGGVSWETGGEGGGFSAFGGTRVVNLGGAGAALTWDQSNFVRNNQKLIFSSQHADSTLVFANPINLAGTATDSVTRTIDVRDGTASVDARLTGAVTSSGVGHLNKIGAGTLELAGVNSYTGTTAIRAGRVLVSGSLTGTADVVISAGATLETTAANVINDAAEVVMEGGSFITGGFSDTLGTFTLAGTATIDLGAGASVLVFANSGTREWTGTLTIANWSGNQLGSGTDQLFFGSGLGGLTAAQVAAIQFIDPEGFAPGAYGANLLPTGELVVVPEPSVAIALLGGGALLVSTLRRRRRSL